MECRTLWAETERNICSQYKHVSLHAMSNADYYNIGTELRGSSGSDHVRLHRPAALKSPGMSIKSQVACVVPITEVIVGMES